VVIDLVAGAILALDDLERKLRLIKLKANNGGVNGRLNMMFTVSKSAPHCLNEKSRTFTGEEVNSAGLSQFWIHKTFLSVSNTFQIHEANPCKIQI